MGCIDLSYRSFFYDDIVNSFLGNVGIECFYIRIPNVKNDRINPLKFNLKINQKNPQQIFMKINEASYQKPSNIPTYKAFNQKINTVFHTNFKKSQKLPQTKQQKSQNRQHILINH